MMRQSIPGVNLVDEQSVGLLSRRVWRGERSGTADKALAGDWVQGIGWDEVSWGGPSPHKSWLDDVCPQNPVILHRMCGHKAVISSSAGRRSYPTHATVSQPVRCSACVVSPQHHQ